MIVTCPQCQTRFRIPDDKVTAKGVKVRCTHCRHTFRVSRPAEPAVAAAADPFAQFAPLDALSEQDKTPAGGISLGDALGIEVEPAGPPPADDFDVDVDTSEARRSPPAPDSSDWSFAPSPPPPPLEASRAPLRPAPPPPPEDGPTPRVSLARIATVRQVSVVRPPEEDSAFRDPSLAAPADDRLELDTGTHHAAWQGSTDGGFELPPPSDPSETDFGNLDLDEPGMLVPQPPPAAAPVAHALLDFDALESVPEPLPSAPPPARTPAPAAPMDVFADLHLAPAPPPSQSAGPALDSGELELGPPAAAHISTPPPSSKGRTPTGELFGTSSTPLDEEAFPGSPGGLSATPVDDRAALFDMPAPVEHEAEPAASLLADVPDAVPDVPAPAPVTLPPVPPTSLGRITRPPTGTSVLGLEERRELGAARRLSGALVNIGVAAVLVVVLAAVGNVYVNEGQLDWGALSPRRWASLLVPPRGIVTLDVSNGLYETRGGRPLAYVRGRVENRGERPGQVRVRAEIWNGSQLLGASEGLAGVLPTPEDMVQASTRLDVEALRSRLQQGAPALAPGKGTDFVLLFNEPPAEVAGLRLKVSAAAVDGR
jgi:predicted Zn finger-like uncharacterized protein